MIIEIGKKYVFNTAYAELQAYNGTKVEIIRQLTNAECDVDEQDTTDLSEESIRRKIL